MTFLNGLLAIGALAAAIPLLIHLLWRKPAVTVEWGAMHLLRELMERERHRLHVWQLLLLLLRCAIPILLAICLARPVLTGFRTLPGAAPRSIVLVVDDSRSMDVRDGDGVPRLQRLKTALRQFLSNTTRQDEVILIRTSQLGAAASPKTPTEALTALRPIEPVGDVADLSRAIDAALDATEKASRAQRHIVIASDFQGTNLSDSVVATSSRSGKRLAAMSLKPRISFLHIDRSDQEPPNVFIDALEITSPNAVIGRQIEIQSRIRNAGDVAASQIDVRWFLDDDLFDTTSVSLPARGSTVAKVQFRIENTGTYELRCQVEVADALPADNERSIAIEVLDRINVLLVDGATNRNRAERNVDFLAVALSPFSFSGDSQPDAIRTKRLAAGDLTEALESGRTDVVVLDNVRSLSEDARAALADFVTAGGGLVIFDGDRVQPESYNKPWESDRYSFSLPAKLGTRLSADQDGTSSGYRPQPFDRQFRPWRSLTQSGRDAFNEIELRAYREFVLTPTAATGSAQRETSSGSEAGDAGAVKDGETVDSPEAFVLWTLTNGDPLAVMKPVGSGRVVQFAVSSDPAWSNLPLRPAYLPMMQQLVAYLAGAGADLTVRVGEPVSVFVAELWDRDRPPADARYTVRLPGGDVVELLAPRQPNGQLVFTETVEPGPYRFRSFSNSSDDGTTDTRSATRVAAIDPIESQLRPTPQERLAKVSSNVGARTAENVTELQLLDRTDRFGREIWKWLLAATVGTMIVEVVVQQQLTRGVTVRAL